MAQMSLVKAERALANRAYVRMLLRLRQSAFAAALASAEQLELRRLTADSFPIDPSIGWRF
jgi:hypothetical protein